MIMHPTFHIAY